MLPTGGHHASRTHPVTSAGPRVQLTAAPARGLSAARWRDTRYPCIFPLFHAAYGVFHPCLTPFWSRLHNAQPHVSYEASTWGDNSPLQLRDLFLEAKVRTRDPPPKSLLLTPSRRPQHDQEPAGPRPPRPRPRLPGHRRLAANVVQRLQLRCQVSAERCDDEGCMVRAMLRG